MLAVKPCPVDLAFTPSYTAISHSTCLFLFEFNIYASKILNFLFLKPKEANERERKKKSRKMKVAQKERKETRG